MLFRSPVPDRLLPLGVQTRRAHGGDGVSERVIAVDHAIERAGRCAAAIGSEVHGEAVGDLLVADGSGFVGECRNDVEALSIDERVLGVGSRPVEGTGSVPVNLDLVVPYVRVKGFEGLIEN